ncbi:MAG: T9SS type A sorting domain-containing protein [Chitinophagales bacterium]
MNFKPCFKCICIFLLICTFQSLNAQIFHATNIPRGGRYDDVTFVNNNIGYTGISSRVYKTINGGDDWTLVSRIDTNAAFRTYSRSIDFIDEDTGFVGTLSVSTYKGGIYRTTNKGVSWKKVLEVSSTSEGVCGMAHFGNTVIGVGTYAGMPKLYVSTNYGRSFITYDLSLVASALVDCYMVDQFTYYIAGMSLDSLGSKPLILKTTDGGLTFTTVALFNTVSGYIWKMYFNSNGVGLASVENNFSDPSMNGYVLRTTDSGNAWQGHLVDTVKGNFGGVIVLNNNIAFIGDQHNYGMWKSSNGGVDWQRMPFSADTTRACNRMILLDNNKVVISGSYIYTSTGAITGTKNNKYEIAAIHTIKVNPTLVANTSSVNIALEAMESTMGLVEIFNLNGQVVYKDAIKTFDKGKYNMQVDISNFSKGIYFAVWKTNEIFVQDKFVIQ